jgi:hypothetical protein
VKLEFAPYLRAQALKKKISAAPASRLEKKEVIAITRSEFDRVTKYIKIKEETAADAQPSQTFLAAEEVSPASDALAAKLRAIPTGAADAANYQRTILEILNFLFEPELIDGELEVRTIDGTERRDIIFTNDSDSTFWTYIRNEHSSLYLMFEAKNSESISNSDLNQTATYLGDRLGRLGFVVTRNQPGEAQMRKAFSIYNDSHPRKIILFLADSDFFVLLRQKGKGGNPMKYIQDLYRTFRTTVQ